MAQLSAGGDLTLVANGGSIYSQGAQMAAEGDALLLATQDIVFDVAHNTESSTTQSRGKGWGMANNTSGLPFGTNTSHSEGSGSSDTITGTQLSVGGGVRMATSEGDITLTAANIAAEKNAAAQLLSHALLGASLAEVNGGNAAGGAAAAAGGELAAKLLTEALYPGQVGELDGAQEQTILALAEAVGAVATGLSAQDLGEIALNAGVAKNSVENNFLSVQLDKKFKHAEDFGLVTSKKNPQTLAQYRVAIRDHMAAPETGLRGTYGFVPGSKVYFSSPTNNAVVLDSSGRFVAGLKLDPKSAQYENLFKNGVLR